MWGHSLYTPAEFLPLAQDWGGRKGELQRCTHRTGAGWVRAVPWHTSSHLPAALTLGAEGCSGSPHFLRVPGRTQESPSPQQDCKQSHQQALQMQHPPTSLNSQLSHPDALQPNCNHFSPFIYPHIYLNIYIYMYFKPCRSQLFSPLPLSSPSSPSPSPSSSPCLSS